MNDGFLPAAETTWIVGRAVALGFDACGVAPAERFPELSRYTEWLERGYAGEMKYLRDPRRTDPREAMHGVRSLIVCALNYNGEQPYSTQANAERSYFSAARCWISRYAWGEDYHQVLLAKLNALCGEMRAHFPQEFEAREYADTGPIHERAAAKYAGLGWLGKNTLLINQSLGSWLFLGVILASLPLQPTLDAAEAPPPDRCGTCRKCLDACPTQAFSEPYVLDASRCISYLTIELRGAIPEPLRAPMGNHVFGCDICQDVCPWNRKSPRTQTAEFAPRLLPESNRRGDSLFFPELLRIARLRPEEFREVFQGSAVKRTKWVGFIRNACIALGNEASKAEPGLRHEMVEALGRLADSGEPVIAESARWALSRI